MEVLVMDLHYPHKHRRLDNLDRGFHTHSHLDSLGSGTRIVRVQPGSCYWQLREGKRRGGEPFSGPIDPLGPSRNENGSAVGPERERWRNIH